MQKNILKAILLAIIVTKYLTAGAIDTKPRFYFSWGYNKDWYVNNNIKVNQPSLRNKYTFLKVNGMDKTGWEAGLLNQDLTIPQYNYRLGHHINEKWAFEINFDHTKYQVTNQQLHIKGTYEGRNVDSTFARTGNNLTYQLNNGANFFCSMQSANMICIKIQLPKWT